MKSTYFTAITLALIVSLAPSKTVADFSFSPLGTVKPCDDYATDVLNDPWDLSNTADLPYFTDGDVAFISNTSFNSGLFSFRTTLSGGGTLRLLSPPLPSTTQVGGRWGNNYPVDVSKYTHFSIRMGLDELDSGGGFGLVLSRGPDYVKFNSFTNKMQTRKGWGTYTMDLNAIGITSSSANTTPWSSGSILGLGVLPSVMVQSGQIDYMRLEDPTSCGSRAVSYTATPTGDNDLYNLYIDSDSNPFNGYFRKLLSASAASGAVTTDVSSLSLQPGSYKIVGLLSSDYATLVKDDPWDMNESTDILATGGVSDATFSSGTFAGIASAASPQIFLRLDSATNIDASKYNKLSFKISPRVDVNLGWGSAATTIFKDSADADADGVYHVDLSGVSGWSGSLSQLVLIPSFSQGQSFTVDFVALRKTGFVANDTTPAGSASADSYVVSSVPVVSLLKPSIKGGEAHRPNNFRPGDTAFHLNLDTAADPARPSESLSAYLPDVRTVSAQRGDFFKGTNISGNDDPNDYLSFPLFTRTNNYIVDASEYKNMCIKMMIDRDYNLTLGSVTKLIFQEKDGAIDELDAWGTIYDFWSGSKWYEYCSDLSEHLTEKGLKKWTGLLSGIRIDPHEFHLDGCCDPKGNPIGNPINATYYYDYFKLRKDDTSKGKYAFVYTVKDDDSNAPNVRFYYNTSKTKSGGTLIPSSDLTCEGKVCIWDTSSVAAGTYYVKVEGNDGVNSNAQLATGRLKITNSGPTGVAPVLSVESPKAGDTVCSNSQFKGFALQTDRFEDVAAVQVFIDGTYFASLNATRYSPSAVTQYPAMDSSNTGFDELHDLSSLSNGSHQVVIKAYSSDGGIASSGNIAITKGSGCQDPTPVVDADPVGTPVTAQLLGSSAPGKNISLAAMAEGNDIKFFISGMHGCSLVRIGVRTNASSDYSFIYGLLDIDEIEKGAISLTSTGVPRFVPAAAPAPETPTATPTPACKKFKKVKQCKQVKQCKKVKGKKVCKRVRQCKNVKVCADPKSKGNNLFTPLAATTDPTVYFIADCDGGAVASTPQTLDTRLIGCADGLSCAHVADMETWFNFYVGAHKPK